MHPILTNRTRLALYLGAWLPVAAVLTAILFATGASGWTEAAVIAFPMCFVYAFVCQSSWYVCRTLPLDDAETVRLIGTHAAAAAIASSIWAGLGGLWVWALGAATTFDGISDRYFAQLPIVFASGVVLFLLAVSFSYLFITFEASQRAEKRALELQVLAREAELKALRAQVDPHFLFNSLNSINALVMADPAAARRMCVLLAEFLRGCLKLGSQERISFGDEMKLAEHYLDIERVRLGARLVVECEIGVDCQSCRVPPLIMQPLVENAITHGVAPLVEGGTLRVEASRHGNVLKIVLDNPFDPDAAAARNGAGLGLKNVKMRLTNLFDGDAQFDARETGGRFRVELRLPCGDS